jgi:hypothetical protein
MIDPGWRMFEFPPAAARIRRSVPSTLGFACMKLARSPAMWTRHLAVLRSNPKILVAALGTRAGSARANGKKFRGTNLDGEAVRSADAVYGHRAVS